MNNFTGFSDLCIPVARIAELKPIIQEAIDLGFHNVAIEQQMDVMKGDTSSKKQDAVPEPFCLEELKAAFGGQIRLLNRLTITFDDVSVSLALNKSKNIRSYNLIAALPTNESSFQYACQSMTCDIITYNSDTIRMKMSRKFYYLAVDRNIAFELKYAPVIVTSQVRKSTIFRAHRYHSHGKSKNVIITSEARNPFQLRSPYDLANLGLIFGLSEEQSKEAIRGIPNRILLSAEGRRFGRAGVVLTHRGKKDMAADSDDYSDSELEEDISDDEEENAEDVDMEGGNSTEEDEESETLHPPKKIAKHN